MDHGIRRVAYIIPMGSGITEPPWHWFYLLLLSDADLSLRSP